ncbi:hypothetical protein QFC22_005093 [Naganishia vaughanmartiniae]|uniref:Uncharacterized protein n=1 Tax=Naganishia vaughanmartiniae TaxID=1424756 RepID=A0ACC2WXS6_9TREE|nr:hypothetical protein QFC22_005093 [Naganishia vaughanmartiniae]
MGGLLIADAAIGIANAGNHSSTSTDQRNEKETPPTQDVETWPRIVALIAFDTPYLGLNPAVFKNSITKYAGHVELAKNVVGGLGGLGLGGGAVWGMFGGTSAAATGADAQGKDTKPAERDSKTTDGRRTRNSSAPAAAAAAAVSDSQPTPIPSSSWTMPAIPSFKTLATAASAAAILTTTAAAAYYKREDLVGGWTWVSDHAVWLKNLWDSRGMRERLSGIEEMQRRGVVFRNYHTLIPPSHPTYPSSRSFCLLPSTTHPLYTSWQPTVFSPTQVEDEVSAHIGMFNARTNEGFYKLGLDVARDVEEALERDLDADLERSREEEEEEEADFLVG